MNIILKKQLAFSAFVIFCFISPLTYAEGASWDGGYIGFLGGYSSGRSDTGLQATGQPSVIGETTSGSTVSNSSSSVNSFTGGLEAGFNHRINQWLVGLEGDIQYSSLSSSYSNYAPTVTGVPLSPSMMTITNCEPVGPNGCKEQFNSHVKSDWYSTLRIRGGVVKENTLFYATAGLALSRYNFSMSSVSGLGPAISSSSIVPGWTLGGGIEHSFRPNFTVKAEYLYLNFANPLNRVIPSSVTDSSGTKYDLNAASAFHQSTIRVGLNYHF